MLFNSLDLPPTLRSEAFAEDLIEPVPSAAVSAGLGAVGTSLATTLLLLPLGVALLSLFTA